jgi:hypothetical protein
MTKAGLVDTESGLDCTESCLSLLMECVRRMDELLGADRDAKDP